MAIAPPPPREFGAPAAAAGGAFITPGYRWGFALVASLFFLWAIANNFNDILIRQFQKSLGLSRAEAGFIQFVFYIGYFVVALPAGLLLRRFGYKTGILIGLALYAAGALLFLPASILRTFPMFLAALFMIAAGAAFLDTTANPYITAFGDPGRAPQRLNLAQAFNGFGGFLAPIIGGLLIFSGVEHSPTDLAAMSPAAVAAYRAAEAQTVQLPYAMLAGLVLIVAGAIAVARLPRVAVETAAPSSEGDLRRLLRDRALVGAIVAQFFYVGAQVGLWSFFIDFVKDATPFVSERQAAYLLSVSLVLFMIGRFVGTALMARVSPVVLLGSYALANIALLLVAMLTTGQLAVGALVLTSFFMSVMFPTIFALGVARLGPLMPLGSSCIIMAIIGGAVFPPLMGAIATRSGSMHVALLAPLACFVAVAVYARRAMRTSGRARVTPVRA